MSKGPGARAAIGTARVLSAVRFPVEDRKLEVDARSIEQASREMSAGSRRELTGVALAIVIAALAGLAGAYQARLAVALAVGAGFALVLACAAAFKRHSLIARLLLERDAYAIPAVRERARRLTTPRFRKRLSGSLRGLVADPWRHEPYVLPERVTAFATDLEEIARDLEQPDAEIDPVSAATCLRLLTEGVESPLLNPKFPVEDLRAALMRIRAGIRPAPGQVVPAVGGVSSGGRSGSGSPGSP